jgi:NAD(P)-dependent dehydrogenase (short-subunit alcohol dehydrogenase family)
MQDQPQPFRPLLQKVAVVTGASRGIGRAIADALAAAGCNLALCARNTKFINAQELADAHGVRVLTRECDVRNEDSVGEFFSAIRKDFGRIDILVNNAGVAAPMAPVEQLSLDDWRDAIDTNLTGTFLCTRAALPLMPSGGTIVNNLSVAARQAFAGQSAYIAAKHGAKGFTDALREELRERGIRVIGLYPGATDTDIWNQFWPEAPRQKMMTSESVAQAVVQAIAMPANTSVDELVLTPTSGRL